MTSDSTKRQRRGHGRPTLHDVADAAGVTRITISRFIRQPGLVAESTGRRIRDAIEQTGYVPNQQAGQLASGASRLVAALIPNVGHSIFAETIQGLAEGLRESAYELLLLSTEYSQEREHEQLRVLTGWAPAAIVVTGRHHATGAMRLLKDAQAAGVPVVEIWDHPTKKPDSAGFAQIGFDHFAVGETMARHLLGLGHTSLCYVNSSVAEDFRAQERGEGFVAEALAQGAHTTVLRAAAGDAFDAGRAILPHILSAKGAPVTAAAFATDHLACGALMQAIKQGIAIPGQLALLGFGDFPIGRQLEPSLSTVRPPTADIGRVAARSILQSLTNGLAPTSSMLLYLLVERGSTSAARNV